MFKIFRFEEAKYFDTVGNLIEECRQLFYLWVDGFDKWNYYTDRRGLFNPPGVGTFEKHPNEVIPFNSDDFFE